jgi:hypothetical protein
MGVAYPDFLLDALAANDGPKRWLGDIVPDETHSKRGCSPHTKEAAQS